jgi:hypothetical protein
LLLLLELVLYQPKERKRFNSSPWAGVYPRRRIKLLLLLELILYQPKERKRFNSSPWIDDVSAQGEEAIQLFSLGWCFIHPEVF